jgi:hypothetical protein
MNQSKLESFFESMANTVVGFVISWFAWPVIAAIVGISFNHTQHWLVVVLFTIISVVRGYVVRRWFNAKLHHLAVTLAKKLIKRRGPVAKSDAFDFCEKSPTRIHSDEWYTLNRCVYCGAADDPIESPVQQALQHPLYATHCVADRYLMDGKGCWELYYYPIFGCGKTGKVYGEPRALMRSVGEAGADLREVPLRYIERIVP